MKKIVLIAIPAIAMLASCAKNEVYTPESDPQQITFTTLVNKTKASQKDEIISGTAYPTDETFGTFAFFNSSTTTFPTSAEVYIPESEVKNTSKATSGTVWTTETAYYWPKQGSLTFFSYSPYDELNAVTSCDATDGIKIDSWNVKDKQTVDVMVADYKTAQKQNGAYGGYTGVPTIFRHKLAQIVKFTFKTDKAYAKGTLTSPQIGDKFFFINSVVLNNLQVSGTYTSGNNVDGAATPKVLGAWDNLSGAEKFTWYDKGTNDGTAFDENGAEVAANGLDGRSYLLVMPQAFPQVDDNYTDAKTLKISYTIRTYTGTGANDYTEELVTEDKNGSKPLTLIPLCYLHGGSTDKDGASWEMNTKYSYTIKIGLDQIYWAPGVVEYEEKAWDEYSLIAQ